MPAAQNPTECGRGNDLPIRIDTSIGPNAAAPVDIDPERPYLFVHDAVKNDDVTAAAETVVIATTQGAAAANQGAAIGSWAVGPGAEVPIKGGISKVWVKGTGAMVTILPGIRNLGVVQ